MQNFLTVMKIFSNLIMQHENVIDKTNQKEIIMKQQNILTVEKQLNCILQKTL